jgi:uncharacterized protein Yka (UPF0111/DUF47 family)
MINPLKSLFGTEQRFLSLIDDSAEQAWISAQELESLMSGPPAVASLGRLFEAREKERQIDAELCELLCQTKNTPLDRGDIELLARALGRIPRGIKKFAERHQLYGQRVADANFGEQMQMLKTAVQTVREMIRELKAGPRLHSAKAHHDTLQKIEAEADELFISSVMTLYRERRDPVRALMLKDLHELLERAIDRCRTSGNIILRIVLKTT